MQRFAALLLASLAGCGAAGQCTCSRDVDYKGADLAWAEVISHGECCDACSKHPGCTVGVFLGRRCYLKNSSVKLLHSPSRIACRPGSDPTKQDPGAEVLELASCSVFGCTGYDASRVCQCNAGCKKHANCCYDFEHVCTASGTKGDTDKGGAPKTVHVSPLCQNYGCGDYREEHKCQCNAECAEHNNCCTDFAARCSPDSRSSTEAPPLQATSTAAASTAAVSAAAPTTSAAALPTASTAASAVVPASAAVSTNGPGSERIAATNGTAVPQAVAAGTSSWPAGNGTRPLLRNENLSSIAQGTSLNQSATEETNSSSPSTDQGLDSQSTTSGTRLSQVPTNDTIANQSRMNQTDTKTETITMKKFQDLPGTPATGGFHLLPATLCALLAALTALTTGTAFTRLGRRARGGHSEVPVLDREPMPPVDCKELLLSSP